MADQVDKLILRTEGAEQVKALNEQLQFYEDNLRDLIHLHDQGLISQQQYIAMMRNSAAQHIATSESIAKVERGMKGFSLTGKAAQQGMMELSYAFQDFVQGGLGGILNNLPRIVSLFGGPAGLAAGIGAAGVAAFIFRDQIKEMFAAILGGAETIPTAKTRLEELNGELKALKDRQEALGKDGAIPVEKIGEYNGLALKRAEIEERIATAKERQQKADKYQQADAQAARNLNAESAAVAEHGMQALGGFDRTVDRIAEQDTPGDAASAGAMNRLKELWKLQAAQPTRALKDAFAPNIARAQRDVAMAQQGVRDRAQALAVRAREGDQGAVADLARRFPGAAYGFETGTKEYLDAADAEAAADEADTAAWRKSKAASSAARKARDRKNKEKLAVFQTGDDARSEKAEDERKEAEKAAAPLRAWESGAALKARKSQEAESLADFERASFGGVTAAESEQLGRGREAALGGNLGAMRKAIGENDAKLRALEDAGRFGDPAYQAFMQLNAQVAQAMQMAQAQQAQRRSFQRGPDVGQFPGFPMMGGGW